MSNEKDALANGFADYFAREAELRNATGVTPIPGKMLDEKNHPSIRQEGANEYLTALLRKKNSELTAEEIAYLRAGVASWAKSNRR